MSTAGENGAHDGAPESKPRWVSRGRPELKLRVFGRELRIRSRSERATRDLLANVVYRVPPEWLDRILEARLANLER